MKSWRVLFPLFCVLVLESSRSILAAPAASTQKQVSVHSDPLPLEPVNPALPVPTEARRMALESAGAFTNDGFRIRDAEWPFSLIKGTPAFLQLTLFEGNHYWFVAATPTTGVKIRVTLYDAQGHPVKSEQWQDNGAHGGTRAAAGIAPDKSGSYFVGVELLGSPTDEPLDGSLVTAYK